MYVKQCCCFNNTYEYTRELCKSLLHGAMYFTIQKKSNNFYELKQRHIKLQWIKSIARLLYKIIFNLEKPTTHWSFSVFLLFFLSFPPAFARFVLSFKFISEIHSLFFRCCWWWRRPKFVDENLNIYRMWMFLFKMFSLFKINKSTFS